MQIPFEVLLPILFTPIISAIPALFWLYTKTQNARLEDYRDRVRKYDEEVLPALHSVENALVQLTDLYEKQQKEMHKL